MLSFGSEKTPFEKVLASARRDLGKREVGNNGGPYVERLFRLANRPDAIAARSPWCGAQAGAWLLEADCEIPALKDVLLANAYLHVGERIPVPVPGCLAVWPRGASKGAGHVNIVETVHADGRVTCIGGNQKNAVTRETRMTKTARGFVAPRPMPKAAPVTRRPSLTHAEEYASRWREMKVDAAKAPAVAAAARACVANKERYREAALATGVPWWFIAPLHYREASFDFSTCLHNGDPLGAKTARVPKGRGPFATWEAAAIDALKLKNLDRVLVWSVERAAHEAERYNGFGYRARGVASEYLWGGTNHHARGKFVADGVYDPTAVSKQVGVMPIIREIARIDPSFALPLETESKSALETVRGSRSLRTGLSGLFVAIGGLVTSAFETVQDGALWLMGALPDATNEAAPLVSSGQQVAGWLALNPATISALLVTVALAVILARRFAVEKVT